MKIRVIYLNGSTVHFINVIKVSEAKKNLILYFKDNSKVRISNDDWLSYEYKQEVDMPHLYYTIKFEDCSTLTTSSSRVAEQAKQLECVKSIILRELTEHGWKETVIK